MLHCMSRFSSLASAKLKLGKGAALVAQDLIGLLVALGLALLTSSVTPKYCAAAASIQFVPCKMDSSDLLGCIRDMLQNAARGKSERAILSAPLREALEALADKEHYDGALA